MNLKNNYFPLNSVLVNVFTAIVLSSVFFVCYGQTAQNTTRWNCEIKPAEHKIVTDTISGAKIIFATTSKANDTNLYFHDRCWLSEEQMMIFISNRTGRNEIWGYLSQTGELVRLDLPQKPAAGHPVVAQKDNKIYVVRQNSIFQWQVTIKTNPKTQVEIIEKEITAYPPNTTIASGLNENCDGKLVSYSYKLKDQERWKICVVDISTSKTEVVAETDFQIQHVQFNWHRPDLISFARGYGKDTAPSDPTVSRHARIWFVNINTKTFVPAFFQQPGELVTHECWWFNDQITFIGGHRPEEAHVKALNILTGEIRIIGAGAWWEGGTPVDLSKVNWWHQSGSPDGRWIAADNWHGIIAIFNAKTTEMHILTTGHRTYGRGAHPHVGWDLTGRSVEFTSNKLGNPDVCIGFIPTKW